ncbi:MAG TPA: cupin domain-containing protein [Bryobacteraceae bacterium]
MHRRATVSPSYRGERFYGVTLYQHSAKIDARVSLEVSYGQFRAIFPHQNHSTLKSTQTSSARELRQNGSVDWKENGIKIVRAGTFDPNTPQTAGMTRAAAITHARTGATKLWAGTVVVNPDAKTGPHHHGELETVLYIVRGRARMRWGERLEFSDEAGPGDFIYVPPYVPHQEINAGAHEPCEAVVVRSGQDPVVVNLDLETPEPASAGISGQPFHPGR